MLQIPCQCVICHGVVGSVSVCYTTPCCRSRVSVSYVTVLRVLCQCITSHSAADVESVCCQVSVSNASPCVYMSLCYRTCQRVYMSLCYRTCVSVFTCLCVTGPVSVCLHVSVLQDLCQRVYMSLCYRTCVSVLEQETCRRQWTGACVETECQTQTISTPCTL